MPGGGHISGRLSARQFRDRISVCRRRDLFHAGWFRQEARQARNLGWFLFACQTADKAIEFAPVLLDRLAGLEISRSTSVLCWRRSRSRPSRRAPIRFSVSWRSRSASAADHSRMCSTSASARRLSSSASVAARDRTFSTWALRLLAISAAICSRCRSAAACIVRAISWRNVGTRPASTDSAGSSPGGAGDSGCPPDSTAGETGTLVVSRRVGRLDPAIRGLAGRLGFRLGIDGLVLH